METKLSTEPARPLTDREVAKLVCGTLGTAAAFGTSREEMRRALEWIVERWDDIADFLYAGECPLS